MADQVAWHVTGITDDTILKPGGSGILDVKKVAYAIDSGPAAGQEFSVTIPADPLHFTAANVGKAVAADAATHDSVHGLSYKTPGM